MKPGILIFLKDPQAGQVKTRLASTVGDREAVRIYRWLVERVCSQLPPQLALYFFYSPETAGDSIRHWITPMLPNTSVEFVPQSSGDLGERLLNAFNYAFSRGHTKLAAIGTDCAEIGPSIYESTWEALSQHDAVIGPTHDGGYYLIALNKTEPVLFENIPWSSPQTLSTTLARASQAALQIYHLPSLSDVDTEEDWLRLKKSL